MCPISRIFDTDDLRHSLPPGFAIHGGSIADFSHELYDDERLCAKNLVNNRLKNYSSGRYYAHQLLAGLGQDKCSVLSDDKGVPVWPKGIIGSISHTREYCVVVAGRRAICHCVGIDIEQMARVTPTLWNRLFTDQEITWIKHYAPVRQSQFATLIFSAKEAFYKCQYVANRRFCGFKDVQISVEGLNRVVVQLMTLGIPEDQKYRGYYQMNDTFVLVVIWLEK